MNTETRKSLKFAVLCDNSSIKKWQYETIKELLLLENLKLELIIDNSNKSKLKIRLKEIPFLLYKNIFIRPSSLKTINISEHFAATKKITFKTYLKGKYSCVFSGNDINFLKEKNLDFILKFSNSLICADILDIPKYGVWSYSNDNASQNWVGSIYFWAIYNNTLTTETKLQRLTSKNDNGIILKRGIFKTINYSFSKNLDQTLRNLSLWPSQVCKNILYNSNYTFPVELTKTHYRTLKITNIFILTNFLLKLSINRIKKILSYTKIDVWTIGIINKSISEVYFHTLHNQEINWLPIIKTKYLLADPFIFQQNNHTYLFFEKLFFSKDKGFISAIKFDGNLNQIDYYENIIPSNKHLSYPQIFKYENSVYMIPESSANNEIALYQSDDFPKNWRKVKVLVENFRGIDTSLLYYNNIWWLFTSQKGNDHSFKLFIFYSNNLLGEWHPHFNNPVKIDVSSCRGAGNFFVNNNDVFRPSQDYSRVSEGQITINKLSKLNKFEFEEQPANIVTAGDNWPFHDKIHTISSFGNITVIDSCNTRSIFLSANYIKNKLARFFYG